MKKILFILVSLFSQVSFCQTPAQMRDLMIMEKLAKDVENDKKNEFEAKKIVLNFYFETKNRARESYKYLSEFEKDQMNKAQKDLWEAQIVRTFQIYRNYKYFLNKEYNMLLKYNEAVMDLLDFALDNDLSENAKYNEFDDKLFIYKLRLY